MVFVTGYREQEGSTYEDPGEVLGTDCGFAQLDAPTPCRRSGDGWEWMGWQVINFRERVYCFWPCSLFPGAVGTTNYV